MEVSMMEEKKNYKDIRKHANQVREKLLKKELLTETECRQLIREIGKLPDVEILPIDETGRLSVEELLIEFNEYAERSKSRLKKFQSLISEGRVPSAEERKEFDEIIEALCQKYSSVCGIAKVELMEDELPTEGSPISAYYDAIKNSKSALLKNQINEIKEMLQRFISVQSPIANLALVLKPFQKNAGSLLDRINNEEITEVSVIKEEAAGPQLFIHAIECEDLNSDEGNEILDSLEEKFDYPSRVTRGLSSKSYFFATTEERDKNSQLEEPYSNVTENIEVQEPEVKTEDKKTSEPVIEEITSSEENTSPEEVEHTYFMRSVEQRGLILDETEYGILSSEISHSETKKTSASVFSNDLRKGNVKAIKNIIQQLKRISIISPELLYLKYHMPANIANSSLGFLQKKGYLRKYKLVPGGEFYCSSPRLDKSLMYKKARKLVGIRPFYAEPMGELIVDKASSAAARVAFLRIYTCSARSHLESKVKQLSLNNVMMTESFLYRAYDSAKPENVEFFAGVFWTNYTECVDFINALEKLVKISNAVDRLVIAGLNKDFALLFLDELRKCQFEILNKAPTYIYVVEEDKFYSVETREEISETLIWPALRQDDKTDS